MMHHDTCIMIHDASWCIMIHHDHDASWYIMMHLDYLDAYWCIFLMHHGASWCIMVFNVLDCAGLKKMGGTKTQRCPEPVFYKPAGFINPRWPLTGSLSHHLDKYQLRFICLYTALQTTKRHWDQLARLPLSVHASARSATTLQTFPHIHSKPFHIHIYTHAPSSYGRRNPLHVSCADEYGYTFTNYEMFFVLNSAAIQYPSPDG